MWRQFCPVELFSGNGTQLLGYTALPVAMVLLAKQYGFFSGAHTIATITRPTLLIIGFVLCSLFDVLLYPKNQLTQDIDIGPGQCVLLEFDTQGFVLDLSCSVTELMDDGKWVPNECHAASNGNGEGATAAATFALAVSGTCLSRYKSGPQLHVCSVLVLVSAVCLWMLAGESKPASPFDIQNAFDVQNAFVRRRCRANDMVPYVNNSGKKIRLCVRFSRLESPIKIFLLPFMSSIRRRGIMWRTTVVTDHNYGDVLKLFYSELSPTMKKLLLLDPVSFSRGRPWSAGASPWLNACLGYVLVVPLLYYCLKVAGDVSAGNLYLSKEKVWKGFLSDFDKVFKSKNGLKSIIQIVFENIFNIFVDCINVIMFGIDCIRLVLKYVYHCLSKFFDDADILKQTLKEGWMEFDKHRKNCVKWLGNCYFFKVGRERHAILWHCMFEPDTLRDLNLINLKESRQNFAASFFDNVTASFFGNVTDNQNLYQQTKDAFQKWRVSTSNANEGEQLFIDVHKLWKIWSASYGETSAKGQLDALLQLISDFPFDWSFPYNMEESAIDLLTLIDLKRLNLILTSDEVCEA
jgi:hypothetical protein